jgi:hypothetical protein
VALTADQRCAQCNGARDRPDQRYCKRCHARYMRTWRVDQKEVRREEVNAAFRRGLEQGEQGATNAES